MSELMSMMNIGKELKEFSDFLPVYKQTIK